MLNFLNRLLSSRPKPEPTFSEFEALPEAEQIERLTGLARRALKEWGLENAELNFIKHRENTVYKVTERDGTQSVLRVHRFEYHSDAALWSEHQWMQSLSESGVSTPPVRPARDGSPFVKSSAPGVPGERQCDILGWVEGAPLGSIEDGIAADIETLKQSFRTMGAIAARVHEHGVKWARPKRFTRHAWDLDGLTGDDPVWGRFWEWDGFDQGQKQLVLEARRKVRAELEAFGYGDDRYGLIHADFLPENLLVDGETINLIDFDDGGFGWHLYDFTVALFFHLGEPHYDAIENAMIEGYRSERALPDDHLKLLPVFHVIRALTLLGWVHTRVVPDGMQEIVEEIKAGALELAEEFVGASSATTEAER